MERGHSTTLGSTQVVTLGIEDEVFAVPVEGVREILDLCPITHLPYAPNYLLGIIDVRGRGVPVIDLRLKLGLPAAPPTGHTRILVLQTEAAGRRVDLGLLTDRVFEVTSLDAGESAPPPDIGLTWKSDYIHCIGRRGEDFVVVLDLVRLFADESAITAFIPGPVSAPEVAASP